MATRSLRAGASLAALALLACLGLGALAPGGLGIAAAQNRTSNRVIAPPPILSSNAQLSSSAEPIDAGSRDFDRALRQQAETDWTWRQASEGSMRMDKIIYRSRIGDLDIPAFVFRPLAPAEARTQPAIVWVHENIRGHLYEHFIPYVRQAVARGFVVIAPEYRGSIGYGQAFYDAIDYGGAEVDDVVTAVGVLKARYASVDPARIGIIGWSHGGLIGLLAVFRNPTSFRAAAAIVPVTNLFQRLAWKGEEQFRASIDPHNRLGGTPAERRQTYRDRSPLFHVDQLEIPLLVHVAENDQDVTLEEAQPLIDALRARKAELAETKVYKNPVGGHLFDRRVDLRTLQPENSPEQVDSWNRVWAFFERQLGTRR
jgi:dipeptidyl aminopeptidase/acylaminoacyl peptidase